MFACAKDFVQIVSNIEEESESVSRRQTPISDSKHYMVRFH